MCTHGSGAAHLGCSWTASARAPSALYRWSRGGSMSTEGEAEGDHPNCRCLAAFMRGSTKRCQQRAPQQRPRRPRRTESDRVRKIRKAKKCRARFAAAAKAATLWRASLRDYGRGSAAKPLGTTLDTTPSSLGCVARMGFRCPAEARPVPPSLSRYPTFPRAV
ncbi:uncharacterized protein PSANT_00678 [Moesziomyces antarcticus]|uniref:Uncharacterized protein n=1 Tax=Pseudozyma antarctica TaxID=84753 RepID=A0A5C3FEZ5_PSEA2|nr:uncharacterized protein PSANT_00678 [Moesziomyces antarcticus]